MKRGLSLLLMLWAVLAGAQTYPTKPVRVIVAVGPGSTDDFFGKIAKDSGIQPH
jgi:tripartite-type tricarboxylate transporter receptor subunit TctC